MCFLLFSSVVLQSLPLLHIPDDSEVTLPPSCVHSLSDKFVGDILVGFPATGAAPFLSRAMAEWFEPSPIIPPTSAVARNKRFIMARSRLYLMSPIAGFPRYCLVMQAEWTTPSLSVVRHIEPESHLFTLAATFPPKPLHSAAVRADGDIFVGLAGVTGCCFLSRAKAWSEVARNRAATEVTTNFSFMLLPSLSVRPMPMSVHSDRVCLVLGAYHTGSVS